MADFQPSAYQQPFTVGELKQRLLSLDREPYPFAQTLMISSPFIATTAFVFNLTACYEGNRFRAEVT